MLEINRHSISGGGTARGLDSSVEVSAVSYYIPHPGLSKSGPAPSTTDTRSDPGTCLAPPGSPDALQKKWPPRF